MIKKSELHMLLKKIGDEVKLTAKNRSQCKPLLDLGLATGWEGKFVITEKGKAFMFQWECEKFLQCLHVGEDAKSSERVANWVLKHQFAVRAGAAEGWKITPRGRDWLSQLN